MIGRDISLVEADLRELEKQVLKWQKVQNLVSRETLDYIWSRHIVDSLQIIPMIHVKRTDNELTIVDIGTGGGFPAIPLAICFKGLPIKIHMIESNGRKCAFLNAMIREFGLNAKVHNSRIENVSREILGSVDILTSRALAALPLLFSYLYSLGGEKAVSILHKGRDFGEELKSTDSAWLYDVLIHKSKTDSEGVILEISELKPL